MRFRVDSHINDLHNAMDEAWERALHAEITDEQEDEICPECERPTSETGRCFDCEASDYL